MSRIRETAAAPAVIKCISINPGLMVAAALLSRGARRFIHRRCGDLEYAGHTQNRAGCGPVGDHAGGRCTNVSGGRLE